MWFEFTTENDMANKKYEISSLLMYEKVDPMFFAIFAKYVLLSIHFDNAMDGN